MGNLTIADTGSVVFSSGGFLEIKDGVATTIQPIYESGVFWAFFGLASLLLALWLSKVAIKKYTNEIG